MGLTASPWQLPYPDPTDRVRDAASSLYYLADRMDFHLTNWRGDDDRLRRRPAAKMTYSSNVKYKINTQALSVVYYNNVQLDTAGMADLQRRPDRIYLPTSNRPALYVCGGTVVGIPALNPSVPDIRLNTNARWSINTATSPSTLYNYSTRDTNVSRTDTTRGETFLVSSQVLAYTPVDGVQTTDGDIWIQIEINSGNDFTVWYADLWAFWSTDVAAIPST